MSLREYDFITGIETSTAPTSGSPSGSNDTITLGYADENYTPKPHVYGVVSDITELKAIPASGRFDEQIAFIAGLDLFYKFNSGSSATPDNDLVVEPDAGTGRWTKVQFSGINTGSASNLESLIQKLEEERYGIRKGPLDNSRGVSSYSKENSNLFKARLLEDQTSGTGTISLVWNPIAINSSDQNIDSTTGWTALNAGASLTTSATKKIGTASLSFDKNGTNVSASIRYDQGSQILSVGSNGRFWFYINLPSITNFSNAYVKIYAGTTSDFSRWDLTTDYAGASLAVGWNLCFVDLSTTASSTGGTPWTLATLSRYQEIGVTTSSAGQTYTAVLLDSIYFSDNNPADHMSVIGNEFSLFNNSTSESIVVADTNTIHDGKLTLVSNISNTYLGGMSGATASNVLRSVLVADGQVSGFNSSYTSGTINTSQPLRFSRILRDSLSGNYGLFADVYTPQIYPVVTPSGTTVTITDPGDTHLNLLSGDVVHVFRKYVVDGNSSYVYLGDLTLTSNSSASLGVTTLTDTAGGTLISSMQTGDYVAKKHITAALSSVSDPDSEESFSTATQDASPNGIQLVGDFIYPNASSVFAHYSLGDISTTEAVRNRVGTASNLSIAGTINTTDSFLSGRLSASSFTNTGYLQKTANVSSSDGNGEQVQLSLWFIATGNGGANQEWLFAFHDGAGNRLDCSYDPATLSLNMGNNGGYTNSGASSIVLNKWNHLFVVAESGVSAKAYLNGVLFQNLGAASSIPASTVLYIGQQTSQTRPLTEGKLADLIIWVGGSELSANQVNYLYNSGNYVNSFDRAAVRNIYSVNGQSGQKVSSRISIARSTSAVNPGVLRAGFVKTG